MKTIASLQYRYDSDWQQRVMSLLDGISSVDLLLFPELAHLPYFCVEQQPKWWQQAITLEHEIIIWARNLAKHKKMHLVFPFFEREQRHYYNSAVVIDADGEILGRYRKVHIPQDPGFSEKFYFRPGHVLKPILSRLGAIGVLICWDQWFPEAARALTVLGADILCYPTAIGWDSAEPQDIQLWQPQAWKIAQQAHALCNQVPVIVSNRWGQEKMLPSSLCFWGQSFIATADGQIQSQAEATGDKLLQADWHNKNSQQWQQHWHFWRDRQPELYQNICAQNISSDS